ncbi:ATP-binding protein [Demequina sp. SYSU T00039]|uniref:ATP-binding protein n=1 Tax=Demequina lignilytica TaxID=3051663 RepID=A0AAW7M9B4_9MICO|nr:MULTISPECIES: ATP-binding protein [unclassified Demequina]MDN4477943.1 ATP-binding protein [Demequina sp. SYSU T00039-1]MDN4487852.1 ATP-binding protein [Demequina sp. SYSU T00039]MDN4490765.1 ATP-binding protein [Demequina sp. SYSU T00068]
MASWRIRDAHADDLEGIVRLWEQSRSAGVEPVYALAEVLTSATEDMAVVATVDEQIVGAAVGRRAHRQAWVVFHGVDDAMHGQGIGPALLGALEAQVAEAGPSTLSALVPAEQTHLDAFRDAGYGEKKAVRYLERRLPVQREEMAMLSELGGRILPRGLWDGVAGMRAEKALIEKRLVLPLAEPSLAQRYGVAPPRAVVMFGPPGTGKTTFAKAIASRLEWSFVEVFPSRLAADPGGLAGALRETFHQIAELEHAVVLIDEVEEIASHRRGDPPSPLQGVTNELLKIIPAFRERPDRLLVCATNFIRSLDSAFLRHGRFDYVIPIGLPDGEARQAIWSRFVPADAAAGVDLDALVAASGGFTPADMEFAARRASQSALEAAVDGRGAGAPGPTTDDYLAAIASTRATVSDEVAGEFGQDIVAFGRV